MKKTVEKILKDIIDATSITDMCDRSFCNWIQPVVDTFVFPEYYLFSSTHLKENIISLLIVLGVLLIFGLIVEEMMKRIFRKNEEKYMWVHKVFEKVIVAFLLFYSMKTIIYFIALNHH
ncbi:hypothetical protein ACFVXR_13960 [Bacillus thuringiensis]|uniref:Malate synthase n=1 Tax=Bacillus thuringiensis serovar toumanoffi TaxID=180862 RepID=A0ABD5HW77_BACTU|nr:MULTISPECIES: hypothetical protein [Bacillus]KXY61373.1 hypothetical protein AT261_03465 [Bacillus cereus]EEM97637.1 hypothetical protein bthur0013_10240 [Bacillus thuringiensis IBL 200]KAB2373409.1 hypothetical protein F8510_22415 [Bacillus sp. RM2(2019)]MCR6779112.1 hypothetical protein [Bacillus thuringiensis]MCR6857180.1 hypothetical protein [Bacillus thuringiensis]